MSLSSGELAMYKHDKALTDRTRAAVKEIIDCVNIMGSDAVVAAAISAELCQSHRTLQASFIRAFQDAMVSYSEIHTDLRNAAAVDFAKKVVAMEHYIPFV